MIGVRADFARSNWTVGAQAGGQFGEIEAQTISAWGIGGDVGWKVSEASRLAYNLTFGFVIGDRRPDDRKSQNVDPFHPNLAIFSVAPLYDLMSGLVLANITENHAQEFGGERRGRHVSARHWRRLAEDAGLSATATLRRVAAITGRILAELPGARDDVAAMPAAGGALLDRLVTETAARARTVAANAARD